MNNFIPFTQEMIDESLIQSRKREEHINHYFESDVMDGETRNQVGFLGEFACCVALGLDWKANIRSDYLTPDHGDLILDGKKIDVKTNTHDSRFIPPHEKYPQGHFLVTEKQRSRLGGYDFIVNGAIDRAKMDGWYPVGFISTKELKSLPTATHHSITGNKYNSGEVIELKYSKLKPLGCLRMETVENYGVTEGVGGEHEEILEDAERFVESNYDEPHETLREAARIIKGLLVLL